MCRCSRSLAMMREYIMVKGTGNQLTPRNRCSPRSQRIVDYLACLGEILDMPNPKKVRVGR